MSTKTGPTDFGPDPLAGEEHKNPSRAETIIVAVQATFVWSLVAVAVVMFISNWPTFEDYDAADTIRVGRPVYTTPVCTYLSTHTLEELVSFQVDAGADAGAARARDVAVAQEHCPELLG